MNLKSLIIQEFKAETDTTLRVLESLENNVFEFRPHDKSMTVKELANHMLLIPSWVAPILGAEQFDWATYTPPAPVDSAKDLIIKYAEYVNTAVKALEITNDDVLQQPWTMKKGDVTFFTVEKHQAIRNLILNHTVHHRAQMGINLRLNNLKVPASYVSSADENLFV